MPDSQDYGGSLRCDWLRFVSALEGVIIVRARRLASALGDPFERFYSDVLQEARHDDFLNALDSAWSAMTESSAGLGGGRLLRLEIAGAV